MDSPDETQNWEQNQPVPENTQTPPVSEKKTPQETDPLFIEQTRIESLLLQEEQQRKEAIEKTKPISYERSVIQNPQNQKNFLETWMNLEQKPAQSVSFNDPILSFTKSIYEEVLADSKKCCTSGLASELERENVKNTKTFDFLKDDYNFYRIGELCYFYSTEDINTIFSKSNELNDLVRRTQKNCLCLNKDSLKEKISILYALLNHRAIDRRTLVYKTFDEFGRQTNRYIISDIRNVDTNLRCCQ